MDTLHPKKYYEYGSGRFQCQAMTDGIGPISRAAYVKISRKYSLHSKKEKKKKGI